MRHARTLWCPKQRGLERRDLAQPCVLAPADGAPWGARWCPRSGELAVQAGSRRGGGTVKAPQRAPSAPTAGTLESGRRARSGFSGGIPRSGSTCRARRGRGGVDGAQTERLGGMHGCETRVTKPLSGAPSGAPLGLYSALLRRWLFTRGGAGAGSVREVGRAPVRPVLVERAEPSVVAAVPNGFIREGGFCVICVITVIGLHACAVGGCNRAAPRGR